MGNPAEIRLSLSAARLALEQDFIAHPQPRRHLHAHSRLVDDHLRMVWQQLSMPSGLALVAVGGYGRCELYPRSDIDLMILLPQQPDAELQQHLQKLVGMLWDIGLEVGNSIRTVADCQAESADVTVQTNLLESRLVAGDQALFGEMQQVLSADLDPRAFYQAKVQEQDRRHARFFETDYNLEPNLKESPGGLRDLQNVLWISRASGFGDTWEKLALAGLITRTEARAITRHEALLQVLRIRLHYLARRREDRLLFDYQDALAQQMGITATAARRASERLMQRYYRTRQAVRHLNEVLLRNLQASLFSVEANVMPINARFVARGDLLEARNELLFEQEPAAILESFLLLEQHPQLAGFSAATLRALWRARQRMDAAFRRDSRNREMFMDILRQPQGITHALRRMNQYGVLGRYLPVFGRIVGQMQHDLFHIHTVDEHILMVVRNLRRFALDRYAHELPLCNQLMKDFARPEVLYIAGLFHDIAKGRGGDHSLKGRSDATRFCRQHGVTDEDTRLVVWLVEHHLSMSSTAQKQDLSDQDAIAAFASKVPNDRYLVALYLLTVADIRGTSPKIWNAWKAKLLEELFNSTRRFMADGMNADRVGEIKTRATELLHLYAIAPGSYASLWKLFDRDYFLRHEPDEIAWHTRLLARHANGTTAVVKARLSRIGEGMQVMVYSPDQPLLFARICSFFAEMHYNIMEARIHTTHNGYALDTFLVLDAGNTRTPYRDVMNYIEFELARNINEGNPLPALYAGRISRQLKHFPISPEVCINKDEKGNFQLSILAGDRPGLLARIARVLADHHVSLLNAKINTLGARAEDSFWIRDASLQQAHAQESLRADLIKQIT